MWTTKAFFPTDFNEVKSSKKTFDNFIQNSKAKSPIDFTEEGIIIAVKDIQNLNDELPIEVNDDGLSKVTFVNDSHPPNAKSFINLREEGIVILVNLEHSKIQSSNTLIEIGDSKIVYLLSKSKIYKILF